MAGHNEFSAGRVVTTHDGRVVVVTLTRPSGHQIVGLPKGHVEEGETDLEAAVREVQEETGLLVVPMPGAAPHESSYSFRDGNGRAINKRVPFFRMRIVGGAAAAHDLEIDGVGLLSVDEALSRHTYPTQREALRSLCD